MVYICSMENNICIRIEADVNQISDCKAVLSTLEGSFDKLSIALSLAANKIRLKILYLLSEEKQLCVCDLSDILEMNTSAISQHLRKLKDRGLVFSKRKGQTIFYGLSDDYRKIFQPLFELIHNNKILEVV